ncbi:DUF4405 domain-containing protein [Rhizobium sp. S-51]|jgi:hypothetical protein|uniref:DUF4405 domain-containing protein n=1 Tax=Rhizobium terricola TaxID=2728849 RepID=A0A7Y0ATN1_9HYPH|nr:DUF4405 domain-containing protein [Rhizobium terricola]NML73238.1 DUF4405 domain-containing protein [Rhizobium terricola]
MPSFLSRYATPFTTGLFLVSLISGIALFFHVGTAAFREMHEWLSLVLVLPFVLHVWKNWRPFLMYFKRLPMAIALAVSLVAGLVFAWPALTGAGAGGNPQMAMISLVTHATPATAAPLFGQTEEVFIAALKEKGLTAAEPGKSLVDIATASGKGERDVVMALITLKP